MFRNSVLAIGSVAFKKRFLRTSSAVDSALLCEIPDASVDGRQNCFNLIQASFIHSSKLNLDFFYTK